MKLRVLALVFGILSTFSLVAQDQFDRLYRTTQRVMTGLDMLTDGGENYYVLSHFYEERDTVQGLNITSFDKKGIVGWSKDYFKDTLIFNTINPTGGIVKSGFVQIDDGFIVSANIMDNREDPEVEFSGYDMIFKIDAVGNLDWSQKTKSDNEDETITSNHILSHSVLSDDLFFNSNRLNGSSASLCNSKISEDGDLLWSKNYDAIINDNSTNSEENHKCCS